MSRAARHLRTPAPDRADRCAECSATFDERSYYARGLCYSCYQRVRRDGQIGEHHRLQTGPEKTGPSRWPQRVTHCLRCEIDARHARYGRRGLCGSCVDLLEAHGLLDEWERVPRVLSVRPTSVALELARLRGVDFVATVARVHVVDARGWCQSGIVPAAVVGVLQRALRTAQAEEDEG